MKVSIRYTVKFEEIKKSVAKLLSDDSVILETLKNRAARISYDLLHSKDMEHSLFLKRITSLREELSYIDQRLEDFSNLLTSYENTKETMKEAAEQSLTPKEDIPKEEL